MSYKCGNRIVSISDIVKFSIADRLYYTGHETSMWPGEHVQ